MEWSYRRSRISDIKNWPNSDDVPRVLIVGFIVAIRYFSEKIKFEVDDGSGVITCNFWLNEEEQEMECGFSDLVTIQGKLFYNSQHKTWDLNVHRVRSEIDPNAESFHWIKCEFIRKKIPYPRQIEG